jgi:aminoglycoside 6-adenylyltransferase
VQTLDQVTDALVRWASEQGGIRALILTSSRANPGQADLLSDYDVILVVTDAASFGGRNGWQTGFGTPLVRWRDEGSLHGVTTYFRLLVYEDGTRIDYTIWPSELLERVVQHQRLPDALDFGYRVLVDKDCLTKGLHPPTFTAFVPAKPTDKEYRALVEEFWLATTEAAKGLWRNELIFVKSFMFEHEIRLGVLTPLLGWLIEIEHDWSLPLRWTGRGLERLLPPDISSEVLSTYAAESIDENWDVLLRLVALFRKVATQVGASLGYSYPTELDDAMISYLHQVQDLPNHRRPPPNCSPHHPVSLPSRSDSLANARVAMSGVGLPEAP